MNIRAAIETFKELLKIAEKERSYSVVPVVCLETIGICCMILNKTKEALRYFNSGINLCNLQRNKDLYRDSLHQSARCKEDLEDYCGDLQYYNTVIGKIGNCIRYHV